MREPDFPDAVVREWKAPEPTAELDQRVLSAYRSVIRPPRFWRRFWTGRHRTPITARPAGLAWRRRRPGSSVGRALH